MPFYNNLFRIFLIMGLIFLSPHSLKSANIALVPNSTQTVQKIDKSELKKLKKLSKKARKHGGYEGYFYVLLFLLSMIVTGLGFLLSLLFTWKIAAWIFGSIFGLQALICLFFYVVAN